MSQMRELGVYKTPDGRAFIACVGILGHYLLYAIGKGAHVFPVYAIDAAGHVVSPTQPTPWTVADLFDTGATFCGMFATPRSNGEGAA